MCGGAKIFGSALLKCLHLSERFRRFFIFAVVIAYLLVEHWLIEYQQKFNIH